MTMRRGLVLPATLAVLLLCGMMIFAAYRMVEMGGQAVMRQIDQTTCRIAAMTALELFAADVQADVNAFLNKYDERDKAWAQPYVSKDTVNAVARAFNAKLAALKASGYAGVDENLARALCGDRGGDMTVTADGIAKTDVSYYRDLNNCFVHYMDITLRVTAQLKRGSKVTGARSTMEQCVRFGALGYDDDGDGKYDDNVFSLPGRAYEFAIHAWSPLRFNTCRGNSYWFINGDIAAKGHIYFGGSGGADGHYALRDGAYPYVSVQGEMHASPDDDAAGNYAGAEWNGRVVGRPSRMALAGTGPGVTAKSVATRCKARNGRQTWMRPESPTVDRVTPGMVSWCRERSWLKFDLSSPESPAMTFNNNLAYGFWDGGYQWQKSTDENVFEGAAAFWHSPPCVNYTVGILNSVNAATPKGTLRTVAQTRGGRTFPQNTYTGYVKDSGGRRNVYIFGGPEDGNAFVIDGPVYFGDDVFVGGAFSGRGTIYSAGNIYVCDSLYAAKVTGTTALSATVPDGSTSYAPNFWTLAQGSSVSCADIQNRAQLALVARGNIVIGDWSRDDFAEKVRSVMPQFGGYGTFHSRRTADSTTDPFAVGGELIGDYEDRTRPKIEPEAIDKTTTWSTASVYERPVLLIESLLVAEHGVYGLVGPGKFEGYTYVGGGNFPANLIVAAWTRSPYSDLNYKITYLPDYCIGEIDGGVVCRDFGICADLDENAIHPQSGVNWGRATGENRPFLLLNHDCRLKASGDAALLDTRRATGRRNSQNPCYLPGDYSSMPQILWWREVHDGTQNVQPDFTAINN